MKLFKPTANTSRNGQKPSLKIFQSMLRVLIVVSIYVGCTNNDVV